MTGWRSREAAVARAGLGDRPYRPMPMRTRSRRVSGCHRRPPVAARWRIGGRRPAPARTRSAARKRARCSSVEPQAGSSARDRWDHRPTTSMSPASRAARAASARAGMSSATAPARDIPVSALRWMRAGSRSARAAAAIASSWPGVEADRSRSARRARRSAEPGAAARAGSSAGASQHRILGASEEGAAPGRGRARPWASSSSRRWRASSSWATPSQVAPAPRQVVATGSRPWP